MGDDGPGRKPLVIAGVAAAVVVLVFLGGAALGAGDSDGSGWRDRLDGLAGGRTLTSEDLDRIGGDSCELEGATLAFLGGCRFAVGEAGGLLGVGAPTRSADLANVGPAAVRLAMEVQGRWIPPSGSPTADGAPSIKPGQESTVTYGPSGGELVLHCTSPSQPCRVELR